MDWDRIRLAYNFMKPFFDRGEQASPYMLSFDFASLFTPIEDNVWCDIRYLGLPLYPQFPIEKYFIDFADPFNRIAIEVDGRQWHINRIDQDHKRDDKLQSKGWSVYRIPGKYTYKTKQDFLNEDGTIKKEYWTKCSEGILILIYNRIGYFEKKGFYSYVDEYKDIP